MANKTAEQLVSDLLDREAIHDVVVRYYDAVWRDDVAGLVDLYTGDGMLVLKYKEEKRIAGRDALLKFYRESMGATNPRPYCHNHVVDLHGNGRASGRCVTPSGATAMILLTGWAQASMKMNTSRLATSGNSARAS